MAAEVIFNFQIRFHVHALREIFVFAAYAYKKIIETHSAHQTIFHRPDHIVKL